MDYVAEYKKAMAESCKALIERNQKVYDNWNIETEILSRDYYKGKVDAYTVIYELLKGGE